MEVRRQIRRLLSHPVVEWLILGGLFGLSVWALRTGFRTALLDVTAVIAGAKVRGLFPSTSGIFEIIETATAPLLIIVPIVIILWFTDTHLQALIIGTLMAALYGFLMGLALKRPLGQLGRRLDRWAGETEGR